MVDFGRQLNVFHDLARYAIKGSFGNKYYVYDVDEFDFPSIEFPLHIVDDKLEISIDRFRMEHGKTRVFADLFQNLHDVDATLTVPVPLTILEGEDSVSMPYVDGRVPRIILLTLCCPNLSHLALKELPHMGLQPRFLITSKTMTTNSSHDSGIWFSDSRVVTKKSGGESKQNYLAFYVHDYLSGHDTSAITVAGKDGPQTSVLSFGTIIVVDDPVTEGPDLNSKVIGRAQGMYINSQLDGKGLHLMFSIIFTDGKYKGSTLEIQGANLFAIVSGTGYFRFVRGYGIMTTHFIDIPNLKAILKLDAIVNHY
ncbi:hypothetical protein H5410_004281 [Solanum commersonii]|uniref:Dirigent protein n=1 Tax=Solanum commersonii TaxID=4109 RepID=A0A9J6B7N5_SOLCO|nr:hypothetical protein H5410_004281 [Solanum commersonii]